MLFSFGLVLLILGAELFVRSALWTSAVTGASKAVIGATVVAFATSGPEFFVSLFAAIGGEYDIAVGNVVGSNICNVGICLGICAIFSPHKMTDKLFIVNGLFAILATILLFSLVLSGALSVVFAGAIALVFVFYTIYNIHGNKGESHDTKKPTRPREVLCYICLFALGLGGLLLGAEVVVKGATVIAFEVGMTEKLVALTLVAIGTSLPEIVTTIVAVIKRESGLSVGNVVGSNLFNATIVLLPAILISGGAIASGAMVWFDIPLALLFMAIAVLPTIITKRVHRWQGLAVATLYVAYLVASFFIS